MFKCMILFSHVCFKEYIGLIFRLFCIPFLECIHKSSCLIEDEISNLDQLLIYLVVVDDTIEIWNKVI